MQLEQLYAMAEAGLVNWSVYYDAVNRVQQQIEDRTLAARQAIDRAAADAQFDDWAKTQDAAYGSNVQSSALQLRQAIARASMGR